MKVKKKLRKLLALIGMVSAAPMPPVLAADAPVSEKIHESRFHMPFPVQKAGEKIDVLVRVEKTDRAYGFYLILVEEKSWPIEKKEELRRGYYGWGGGGAGTRSFSLRVRFLVDFVDFENENHIDQTPAATFSP